MPKFRLGTQYGNGFKDSAQAQVYAAQAAEQQIKNQRERLKDFRDQYLRVVESTRISPEQPFSELSTNYLNNPENADMLQKIANMYYGTAAGRQSLAGRKNGQNIDRFDKFIPTGDGNYSMQYSMKPEDHGFIGEVTTGFTDFLTGKKVPATKYQTAHKGDEVLINSGAGWANPMLTSIGVSPEAFDQRVAAQAANIPKVPGDVADTLNAANTATNNRPFARVVEAAILKENPNLTPEQTKNLLEIGGRSVEEKLKLSQAKELKQIEKFKALASVEREKLEDANRLALEKLQFENKQTATKNLAQQTRLKKMQDSISGRIEGGFKKLEGVIAEGSPGDQWRAAGELERDLKFFMATHANSLKNLNLPGISDSMLKDMTAPLTLAIDKAREGAFMNEFIAHKKFSASGASGTPNSTAWNELIDIYSQGDSPLDGLAKMLHLRDSPGMDIDRNFADFLSIENGYLQVYNSSEDRHSYLNPPEDPSWSFAGWNNKSKDRPGMPYQMGDPEPLANYPMWFQRGIKERIAKSIKTYDEAFKGRGTSSSSAATVPKTSSSAATVPKTPMTPEQEQVIKNMNAMETGLFKKFPNIK